MPNNSDSGRTSRIEMKDQPTEVARAVDKLDVDSVSEPFTMINARGKTVCAVVKLKSRTPAHKANMQEDFQVLSNVVLNRRKDETIRNWVKEKIKSTYVKMDDRYKNCDFEYEGWVK
jgi:peptidyl-prolyl cis-trans isomerase SurA